MNKKYTREYSAHYKKYATCITLIIPKEECMRKKIRDGDIITIDFEITKKKSKKRAKASSRRILR